MFWGYSKWQQSKVLKDWTEVSHQIFAAKKYKPCEIYTRMYDANRSMFYSEIVKWTKNGFATTSLSQKTVDRGKTQWLSSKEILLSTAVNKEGHADSLLGPEGSITIDFLKNNVTLNNTAYYQLLCQNSPFLLNNTCIIHIYWLDTPSFIKYFIQMHFQKRWVNILCLFLHM